MTHPTEFGPNSDLRGMAWAITTADGAVLSSGAVPDLLPDDSELSSADYYIGMTDKAGGALHIAPIAVADDSRPSGPLVLGRPWAEIQAMQQGQHVSRPLRARFPAGSVEVYRAGSA
jgi:hypothetical protein